MCDDDASTDIFCIPRFMKPPTKKSVASLDDDEGDGTV
jgi:hypothetical protein